MVGGDGWEGACMREGLESCVLGRDPSREICFLLGSGSSELEILFGDMRGSGMLRRLRLAYSAYVWERARVPTKGHLRKKRIGHNGDRKHRCSGSAGKQRLFPAWGQSQM